MKVRRVVTGHTLDGRSTVASDTEMEGVTFSFQPGLEFHQLWGADSPPTFPDDGSPPTFPRYFPPVGGFRFILFTVPPMSETPIPPADPLAAQREAEEKLPGLVGPMEPDHPGMHTTDSVDFEFVISGEVFLELDDGVEVHLRPGDTVIQNGTRHAWWNRGSEPCRMVSILIGAHRK
jgi:mannose-6-phosphate isomerase-like protein (cupin superfamily)